MIFKRTRACKRTAVTTRAAAQDQRCNSRLLTRLFAACRDLSYFASSCDYGCFVCEEVREREKAALRRRCCKKPSSSTVLSSFSHGVISVVAGVAIITSCCFFFCFFFNKCSAKRCSDSAILESDIGIVRRNGRSRMFTTDRRDQDAAAIGSQQSLQGNLELRHDDRGAGRSARIVEGIDPVRNALDAQVHSAHGLQRRPSIRAHRSSNRQDQRCRPLDSRFRCRRARSSRHRHSFRGTYFRSLSPSSPFAAVCVQSSRISEP